MGAYPIVPCFKPFGLNTLKYYQAKMIALAVKVRKGEHKLHRADLLGFATEPWETAFTYEHCINGWKAIEVHLLNRFCSPGWKAPMDGDS